MSTQLIQPGDFELKGIFLLSRESLLQLDEILNDVDKEFARFTRHQVGEAAKKRLAARSLDPVADKKRMKAAIASEYPYNCRKREIEVTCASKKKFVAKRFSDILEDPLVENEKPLFATVKIRNGNADLRLKLLGQFVGDEIDVSISPNLAFAKRAVRRIRDWAEDNRRFDWYAKLAFPLGFIGFMLCVFSFLLLSQGLFTTTSDKEDVLTTAREILSDGVDESEAPHAIAALLRLHVNDFKSTTYFDPKPWYLTLLIIAAGLALFGVMCPKSTIGVGQQEKRLHRIEFFSGKIWFWAGAWVFAIFSSAVGSVIFEVTRKVFQGDD